MGLCLLVPMICEKGSTTSLEEENYSDEKVSKHSVRRSIKSEKVQNPPNDKAMNPPKDKQKSNKLRICLLCHRRVSRTALPVAQNFSVNTNFQDDKSGSIYCTCSTSYLRSN